MSLTALRRNLVVGDDDDTIECLITPHRGWADTLEALIGPTDEIGPLDGDSQWCDS